MRLLKIRDFSFSTFLTIGSVFLVLFLVIEYLLSRDTSLIKKMKKTQEGKDEWEEGRKNENLC